jgi:hypothetical protein
MPFGAWPLERSLAGNVPGLAPTALALRNWWQLTDYVAASGTIVSALGSRTDSLVQAVAGKRGTYNAASTAFNNRATITLDGVDDDYSVVAPAISNRPNSIGLVCSIASVLDAHLIGGYFTASYQFFQASAAIDRIVCDPGGNGWVAADVAPKHFWLWSCAAGNVTLYRDGVSLGTVAMAAPTGVCTTFYMGSAGGGYSSAEVAEFWTADQVVTDAEANRLWLYTKAKYGF